MKQKLFLTLIALFSVMGGVKAETQVIARMSDLVDAATSNNAKINLNWKASEGDVYQFDGSTQFIGGITNEDVVAAIEGDQYVTVAMYVYGNSLGGCPFGYGDGYDGLKWMFASNSSFSAGTKGTYVRLTTKSVSDFNSANLGSMTENAWNLVAFTVPGKALTSATASRYLSPAGHYTASGNTLNSGNSGNGMKTPADNSKKFAIGSGNQGDWREGFNGMIANVTVITSSAFLTIQEVQDQMAAAPTDNSANVLTLTYNITATNNGSDPISWTETKEISKDVITEATVSHLTSYSFISDYEITDANKTISSTNKTFTVTANHTLPMVPGKYYFIRYMNGVNPWYLGYVDDNNINIKAAKNVDDAKTMWYVKQPANANAPYFSICNVSSEKAIHAKNDQNDACESINGDFAYEFVKADGQFRIFEPGTSNNIGAHGKYPTNTANSGIGRWNTNNRNSGTTYTVQEVNLDLDAGTEGFVGYCSDLSSYNSAKNTFNTSKTPANLKELLTAKAGLTRIQIDANKYYQLTFTRSNRAIGNYGAVADTEGTVLQTAESRYVTTDPYATANTLAGLWKFEDGENGTYLKTVQTGFYLADVNSGHFVTTKEKAYGKQFILSNGNNNLTTWQMYQYGLGGRATVNGFYNNQNTSFEIGYWDADDAGDYFTIKEVTDIPVTIGEAAGYSTACFPMNVVIPNTVEAYIINANNASSVSLAQVEGILPAGEGVILKNEGTHNFTITSEDATAEVDGNLLTGTTVRRVGFGENANYVLANKSNGVGLYRNGSIDAVPANKAYMSANAGSSSAAMLSLGFGEDEIETAIKELEAEKLANSTIYDVQGRRVQNPTKGLYIINGKKVMVK